MFNLKEGEIPLYNYFLIHYKSLLYSFVNSYLKVFQNYFLIGIKFGHEILSLKFLHEFNLYFVCSDWIFNSEKSFLIFGTS